MTTLQLSMIQISIAEEKMLWVWSRWEQPLRMMMITDFVTKWFPVAKYAIKGCRQ